MITEDVSDGGAIVLTASSELPVVSFPEKPAVDSNGLLTVVLFEHPAMRPLITDKTKILANTLFMSYPDIKN